MVNTLKTKAIQFTRTKPQLMHQITIYRQDFPWFPTAEYLGVILDSKMTWAPAIINSICLSYTALNELYQRSQKTVN